MKRKIRFLKRNTIKLIGDNFGTLLTFEILFKTFFYYIVLLPVSKYLFNYALLKSKYKYLTKENIDGFLRSPLTIAVIAGVVIAWTFFALTEVYSMITIYQLSCQGRKIRVNQLFATVIMEAKEVLIPKNVKLFIMSLIFVPIMNINSILAVLSNFNIVSMATRAIRKSNLLCSLCVVGIVIMVMVIFYAMFMLHYCIVEDTKWSGAAAKVRELFKNRKYDIIFQFLLTNIVMFTLLVAIYYILVLVVMFGVKLLSGTTIGFAFFLSITNIINESFRFVMFNLFVIINLAVVSSIVYSYKAEMGYDNNMSSVKIAKGSVKEQIKKKKSYKVALILVVTINAVYFADTLYNGELAVESAIDGTVVCSHRGYSAAAPENTIPSLEAAIDSMADMAEIDVQETKDGVVVVLHDSNLKRVAGQDINIWDITYEEAKMLDVGAWFSEEYEGTTIPTLEEVLELCKGKIKLNIEIKINGHQQDLENKVAALIDEYDFERQCVVTSFRYSSLVAVKKVDPDIQTGYIMNFAYGNYMEDNNIDFFSIDMNFVTQSFVKEAHTNGKEVYVWTVNREKYMEKMLKLGVDGIITDDPVLASEVLYTYTGQDIFTRIFDYKSFINN